MAENHIGRLDHQGCGAVLHIERHVEHLVNSFHYLHVPTGGEQSVGVRVDGIALLLYHVEPCGRVIPLYVH